MIKAVHFGLAFIRFSCQSSAAARTTSAFPSLLPDPVMATVDAMRAGGAAEEDVETFLSQQRELSEVVSQAS